jgi:DNA-directed RNA polymerase subunit N (RpoN/RPB10)
MKRCFKCGETKPMDSFYKHAAMGDGRLGKCKECTKKDAKAVRLAKIDHYREYDRLRASQPHRKVLAKRVNEAWKASNPKRRAAQVILGNAVRRGAIRPLPCFVCGSKAEAHHPDYDAPLSVVWLCPPHHKQTHAMVA